MRMTSGSAVLPPPPVPPPDPPSSPQPTIIVPATRISTHASAMRMLVAPEKTRICGRNVTGAAEISKLKLQAPNKEKRSQNRKSQMRASDFEAFFLASLVWDLELEL